MSHVQHLLEFLQNVKKEKPMTKCYKQVIQEKRYLTFKETFSKTKGITLKENIVKQNLDKYITEMEASFDDTVSNAISTLQSRIQDIKDIHAPAANSPEQFKKF